MPVSYQSRTPATPAASVVVKTTETADGSIQHVVIDELQAAAPVLVQPAPYHASPFGGFRTANDFLAQDNVHTYPGVSTAYETDKYGYESGGGGTISHLPSQSALRLSLADATNGAKSRLRTHDQVRYQSGAATHIKLTAYISAGGNATLYSVSRSSASGAVVERKTVQSSWNRDASAVTVTNSNIYEIMYQWLGVGDVWFFVNGELRHVQVNAGQLTEPYMKTATLPLSFEIVNEAGIQYVRFGQFDDEDGVYFEIQRTAAAGSFTHICASARILNGISYPSLSFGFSRALTNVGATLVPLFSMRVKNLLNGVSSRIFTLPTLLAAFAETREGTFALVMNPSLTGPTWAATSPSSGTEIDTAASAMSGGTELSRISIGQNASSLIPLTDVFTIPGTKIRKQAFTGTSDILTLGVAREGTVNFDPRATLNWREVR